jgi:hypothetical protein
MKPIKNLEPFSKWVLRISLVCLLASIYYNTLQTFDYKNYNYLIIVVYVLSSLFILLGGLQKKATMTIISAIFLTLISFYQIYLSFNGDFLQPSIYQHLMISGIGLFFVSKGN